MKEMVRLRTRPSRNGKSFVYLLDFRNSEGKRVRLSLGHADLHKAERQRLQKERELRIGFNSPVSMRLNEFLDDSILRTGDQVRESTRREYRFAMRSFIEAVGDIDYQAVTFKHGERFRQYCLDQGNSPATVSKKLRALKRLFELAIDRGQFEKNPLRRVRLPKVPKRKVHVFTAVECERILRVARQYSDSIRWDLLIVVALTTGMRRGELLNTVWADIDFEKMTIEVTPKKDKAQTWAWDIKDNDRRTLPLTENVVLLLAEHQVKQPVNQPYVFIPPYRYEHIQQLRQQGKWSFCDARLKVLNNFAGQFIRILKHAGIDCGQFHDLRRTALSNWLANGLSEYEVMSLAGHAVFDTTHKFYLAVQEGLTNRARQVSCEAIGKNLARVWHAPQFSGESV